MTSATPFTEMKYERVPLAEMKTQYEDLQRRLQSADASDARLDVTEVSCGGVRWTTLGGTLLQTGQLTFTPWNGVFFELQRR